MTAPPEVLAQRLLHQLSGVRAGTLPMVLATRLAEIQLLHVEYTICAGHGDGGLHPLGDCHAVCDTCDCNWPCPTYRMASDGTVGWPE